MNLSTKVFVAAINYQRLDDVALQKLKSAKLVASQDAEILFKEKLGFNVDSLCVIDKCNAVLVLISYEDDLSIEFVKGRLLATWDECSSGGITDFTRDIRFFENIEAIRYIAECSLGLHSVTIGDSQVLAQVIDGIVSGAHEQTCALRLLPAWLKDLATDCRLRTTFFDGNTSIERIAAEVLLKGRNDNRPVAILGFGRSGKLIAKILNQENGVTVRIFNRSSVSPADEGLHAATATYVPLGKATECKDFGSVIIALENSKETSHVVTEMLSSIMQDVVVIDVSTPPFSKSVGFRKIVTITELSEIASANAQLRRNEAAKVRELVQKKLPQIVDLINKNSAEQYIKNQKNSTFKGLDEEHLALAASRSLLFKTVRACLEEKGFIEVTTPYIVGFSTDPPRVDKGSTIGVDWINGSKAFLRQSNQMYKQILIASGLKKIYEIGPFWRHEVNDSYRHLQESIGLDVEISEPKSLQDLYELACEIILFANSKLIQSSGVRSALSMPKLSDIPVLTYYDALELLNQNGHPTTKGEDLSLVGEAKLGQIIKKNYGSDIVVIKNYPDTIKKFYTKNKEIGLTETFDVIVGGWELVSGAIRQSSGDQIKRSMALSGIDVRNYMFYISAIDGAVEHGGFCIGIDRLAAKILDKEMVTDAVLFPRTYRKLIP